MAPGDFELVCPGCGRRCAGKPRPLGAWGSHRVPHLRLGVRRIVCGWCGLVRELGLARARDYRLWYRFVVDGHTVWARNRAQLARLADFLEHGGDRNALELDDLPAWMLEPRRRRRIVERMRALLAAG